MEKIRIQRSEEEFYRINISDDGKEIVLDPLDTDFPIKLDKAVKNLDKNQDVLKQKMLLADKKPDTERNGAYTNGNYEKLLAYSEYNKRNRQIIDELFGRGTCDALFGDKNYVGMYEDLFLALAPHLNKLYGDVNPILERVKKKYAKVESNILK